MRAVALRYFNVAGASENFGEDHNPETHLIPNVLRAIEGGAPLTVHGTDYPTPDGTCIRDYIDVRDLAAAHLAALEQTATAVPGLEALNLGSGTGFSVRQVLHAAEAVTGQRVPHEYGPTTCRRSAGSGCLQRARPTGAGLARRTRHARGHDRLGVALATVTSPRVRGITSAR